MSEESSFDKGLIEIWGLTFAVLLNVFFSKDGQSNACAGNRSSARSNKSGGTRQSANGKAAKARI